MFVREVSASIFRFEWRTDKIECDINKCVDTHFPPFAAAPADPWRELGCRWFTLHLHTTLSLLYLRNEAANFIMSHARARFALATRSPSMVNWHTAVTWVTYAPTPLSFASQFQTQLSQIVLCSHRDWPTKTTKMLFTQLKSICLLLCFNQWVLCCGI